MSSVGHGDGPTTSPQASIPVVATAETEPQKQSLFFHRLDLITHQAQRANTARTDFAAATRKFLRRWDARVLVINFRKLFGATIRRGSALLVEARGKIRERRYSEALKRSVAWIATLVVAVAQKVHATTQLGYPTVKARAKTYLSTISTRLRATRQSAVQHDTAPAEPPVETLALRPVSQARLKPRILAGLPLKLSFVVKRLLPGTERLHAKRRDSRLWTSLAMAGLSALLLLGFVLTVKHYATEALPSHVLHNNSLTERAPAEAAGVASQKPAAPVESAGTTKRTAIISPKRIATPRAVKPKPRQTEDDDYVARDTFVSYENRRTRSR
jgi:hypothetical protein